jgi:hypothetical protein
MVKKKFIFTSPQVINSVVLVYSKLMMYSKAFKKYIKFPLGDLSTENIQVFVDEMCSILLCIVLYKMHLN